jgi:hypothetical protein
MHNKDEKYIENLSRKNRRGETTGKVCAYM